MIDIFADFRNSMSAGQNKVYWGPGGLYREIEPNRKIFRIPSKRLCKTHISTKTKRMNIIGGGRVRNKMCWKCFKLLFQIQYFLILMKSEELRRW